MGSCDVRSAHSLHGLRPIVRGVCGSRLDDRSSALEPGAPRDRPAQRLQSGDRLPHVNTRSGTGARGGPAPLRGASPPTRRRGSAATPARRARGPATAAADRSTAASEAAPGPGMGRHRPPCLCRSWTGGPPEGTGDSRP